MSWNVLRNYTMSRKVLNCHERFWKIPKKLQRSPKCIEGPYIQRFNYSLIQLIRFFSYSTIWNTSLACNAVWSQFMTMHIQVCSNWISTWPTRPGKGYIFFRLLGSLNNFCWIRFIIQAFYWGVGGGSTYVCIGKKIDGQKNFW